MFEDIHSLPPHNSRPLEPPKVHTAPAPHERTIPVEKSVKRSLHSRVRIIPRKILAIFADDEIMKMVVLAFSTTEQILSLIGSKTAKYIPYLNIASSPFYLYHAIKGSAEHIHTMILACKLSKIGNAFFWGLKGAYELGEALSEIVKPFAGGVELAGLTMISAIGLVFTLIIPSILITFGTVGGIVQLWALVRTKNALVKFRENAEKSGDTSLLALSELLRSIQGPTMKGQFTQDAFARREYIDRYFSNKSNYQAVQSKIEHFYTQVTESKSEFSELSKLVPKCSQSEEATKLFTELHGLFGKLLLQEEEPTKQIDTILNLYDKLQGLSEKDNISNEIRELSGKLSAKRQQLVDDAKTILSLSKGELYRKLFTHALFLVLAAATLTAGVLFMFPTHPDYLLIASVLALASSSISFFYFLGTRNLSQERMSKLV